MGEIGMAVIGAAVVVLIVILMVSAVDEEADWSKFVRTHHCQVTGHMRASKTGWTCDDGQTYWR